MPQVSQSAATSNFQIGRIARSQRRHDDAYRLLSDLREAIERAISSPDDVELWDHAGVVRSKVLLNPDALTLIQRWGIDLGSDLDQIHPVLVRVHRALSLHA